MVQVERHRHRPDSPWTYEMLDARQREIAIVAAQGGEGALLMSEVAPVITYGRRTPPGDLRFSEGDFRARGVGIYPTDRGGLATYHGPGQWVIFAVDRLERLTGDRRGVRKAVCALLDVACEVAREYDPFAEIRSGAELGVWGAHGKVAAVGIHVKDGVVLHGLSVNGFATPESFFGLRPCGLDAPVGFLLAGIPGGESSDSRQLAFAALGSRLEKAALKTLWASA